MDGAQRVGRTSGCLNRYRFLVRTQRIFLSLLSTVVAIAVVQTNALRNALIDSSLATIRDFPPEFVIFYGLIFALAVSCVYLPPAYELRQAGMSLQRAVVDMTSSAPTEGSTPVEQWISRFERETKVAHDLGLDVSILARVQTSLGLLAPLLVSIASTMFPK